MSLHATALNWDSIDDNIDPNESTGLDHDITNGNNNIEPNMNQQD